MRTEIQGPELIDDISGRITAKQIQNIADQSDAMPPPTRREGFRGVGDLGPLVPRCIPISSLSSQLGQEYKNKDSTNVKAPHVIVVDALGASAAVNEELATPGKANTAVATARAVVLLNLQLLPSMRC